MKRADPFVWLPDELCIEILSCLGLKMRARTALVSKRWRDLCSDKRLWKRLDIRERQQHRWFCGASLLRFMRLGGATNVRHLNLRGSVVELGFLLRCLPLMRNLEHLNMSDLRADVENLDTLRKVNLRPLKSLTHLTCRGVAMQSARYLLQLCCEARLQFLDCSMSHFEILKAAISGGSADLRVLHVRGLTMTAAQIQWLIAMLVEAPMLRKLDLSFCDFPSIESVCHLLATLNKTQKLHNLNLSHPNYKLANLEYHEISAAISRHVPATLLALTLDGLPLFNEHFCAIFARCIDLQSLSLEECDLQAVLPRLPRNLTSLNLNWCSGLDDTYNESNCQQLLNHYNWRRLELNGSTFVTDSFLQNAASLWPNMQYLSCNECTSVTRAGISQLWSSLHSRGKTYIDCAFTDDLLANDISSEMRQRSSSNRTLHFTKGKDGIYGDINANDDDDDNEFDEFSESVLLSGHVLQQQNKCLLM